MFDVPLNYILETNFKEFHSITEQRDIRVEILFCSSYVVIKCCRLKRKGYILQVMDGGIVGYFIR